MPLLFMNKISFSVPENTVLTFLPRLKTPPVSPMVRFLIGGVWFETTEDVVTFVRGSFFKAFISNPMNAAATPNSFVLTGPPFDNAELFPLVFDFMCRKRSDCMSVLRTVALTKAQSLELDKIEDYLFPCPEPLGTDRPESETGPKYAINPTNGMVQVAILPEYRTNGDHCFAEDGDFIFHEHVDLCTDPRFVQLVLGYQNAPEEGYTLNSAMVAKLNGEYGLGEKPITLDVIKHCQIKEIERGTPFVITSHQERDCFYLELLTEWDSGFDWTVV